MLTVGFVITGGLDVLGVSSAAEVLRIQVTGAGVLIGSLGTGGLVGALPGASLARGRRLASVIVLGGAVEGLALACVAVGGGLVPALVLLATAGTAGAVMLVSGRTLLERSTDDRVLARVFAIQESATPLGTALGAVPGPLAIAWFSPRGGFVPIGLACALLAVTGWCSSVGTTPVRPSPVGDRAAARRSLPVRAS